MPERLVLCDFDGTITVQDTNQVLSERFAPRAFARLESMLLKGQASLREVLASELGEMTAGLDEIVRTAVEQIPIRDGFSEFVAGCRDRGETLIILSAGFRQIIEPMLTAAGHADLPLIANDVEFTEQGGRVTWRDLESCTVCGEECKRADVARLGEAYDEWVYIGDGYSDRCGSLAADRIFACNGLADWLDARSAAHERFETFHQITDALAKPSV